MVLVKPEKFENAAEIADHLRERRTVVLNLEETAKEVARRLVDFPQRRHLCPGWQDQKGGRQHLYHHAL